MEIHCPLCSRRISDWEASNKKVQTINGQTYHKACLMDSTIQEKGESHAHLRPLP